MTDNLNKADEALRESLSELLSHYEDVVIHAVTSGTPDYMNGVKSSYMNMALKAIKQRDAIRDKVLGGTLIGEDEDSRHEDENGHYVQDYEDACDKESRNELRQEQRQL